MKTRISILAILLLCVGIVGTLQALPINSGYDDQFFSDATFSTMVGERYQQCGSGRTGWGVVSSYVYTEEWDCQTFEPIDDACSFYICGSGFVYDAPGGGRNFYGNCECES